MAVPPNVYRTVGPTGCIIVGLIDIVKGALALFMARMSVGSPTVEFVAGLADISGHNWPMFLQFRAGRGADTTLGSGIVSAPSVTIPLTIPASVTLALSRRPTLALDSIFIPHTFRVWAMDFKPSVIFLRYNAAYVCGSGTSNQCTPTHATPECRQR